MNEAALMARYSQRLGDFKKALARLHEALALPASDIVRDAVIQRFEFTYEVAWKTARLWLAVTGTEVLSPKESLAAALAQGLVKDGNLWSELHRNRNLTSHTYNEETAQEIYTFISRHASAAFAGLLAEFEKRPPA